MPGLITENRIDPLPASIDPFNCATNSLSLQCSDDTTPRKRVFWKSNFYKIVERGKVVFSVKRDSSVRRVNANNLSSDFYYRYGGTDFGWERRLLISSRD